jgi:hypothetical protein
VAKESPKDYPHDPAMRNDGDSFVCCEMEEMIDFLEDTALERCKRLAFWGR